MIKSFTFAATPNLHFGPGKLSQLDAATRAFGTNVLLVTGKNSFSENASKIEKAFAGGNSTIDQYVIDREPTPDLVDVAVNKFHSKSIDVVVAIGGGSVLDAGKAISAMLSLNEPVKKYLEGVGTAPHPGTKIPFIAIPTTSGTGSESTKNAVISETDEHGYKKSLRHSNFVPDVAIIDPELTLSCPQSITAASGMDAFTQLLESYLSTAANPITDALALQGLEHVARSLTKTYFDGSDINARTDMALAAYLSGVTLANAGLGLVHGFASSIGGFYPIPHGVICSALMPASNWQTVKKLRESKIDSPALSKYTTVGKLFARSSDKANAYYVDFLLHAIDEYLSILKIPKLGSFGITNASLEKIALASDSKNNPVAFDRESMIEVLQMSL